MGCTEFPPITVKDLRELAVAYSNRIDYSAAIDIIHLPAKALLFFAALYARIYSGILADERPGRLGDDVSAMPAISESLRNQNLREGFTYFPFLEKSETSILEFRQAGLQPTFSCEQFSYLLSKTPLRRIEYRPGRSQHDPPHLRVFFQTPITEPITDYSTDCLDVILLAKPLPSTPVSSDIDEEIPFLETDEESVRELTFEDPDQDQRRIGILLKLLWLASKCRTVIGLFWANAQQARQLAMAMGRTELERFATERFFALGFRTASANQPWLRRDARYSYKDKVDGPTQCYESWKQRVEFFEKFGLIEVSLAPESESRKAILLHEGQVPRGLQLLNSTKEFRSLAQLFLRLDPTGGWVIEASEVRPLANYVDLVLGSILSASHGALCELIDSFQGDCQFEAAFLFELGVGLLDAMARLPGISLSDLTMRASVVALRLGYEEVCDTAIVRAPSLAMADRAELSALREELDRRRRRIWELAVSGFEEIVWDRIEEEVDCLRRLQADNPLTTKPRVDVGSTLGFESSIGSLAQWLKAILISRPARSLESEIGSELALVVAFRKLAEENQFDAAHAKANRLLPLLGRKRRTEFERCLSTANSTSAMTTAATPAIIGTNGDR